MFGVRQGEVLFPPDDTVSLAQIRVKGMYDKKM